MYDEQVNALIELGEREGCLEFSEVARVAEASELDDEEVERLYEDLQKRGVEVTDDCGRAQTPDATYVNGNLAESTTDALQLFLNEMGKYKLLTAEEEVELAKRIERGDQEAKDRPDGQLEPPPGRLDCEEIPGPRALATRPDSGRDHRVDPRRREVRLAQGVPLNSSQLMPVKPLFFTFLILTLTLLAIFQVLDKELRTDAAPNGILSFELAGNPEAARAITDSWKAYASLARRCC